MAGSLQLKPLGDSAWLIEFPALAGMEVLHEVWKMSRAIQAKEIVGIQDIVSSFDTLAVHFGCADGNLIRDAIEEISPGGNHSHGALHHIPVCYDLQYGIDLEAVAAATEMSVEQVIEIHSATKYLVAAVGFSPGFPYLLGLPEILRLPRKSTPRLSVPAGSVGIAGTQAGIYPQSSPAGWHILGKTDALLFDPGRHQPSTLQVGDRVRFDRVDQLSVPKMKSCEPSATGSIEVIEPGGSTTVQDLGRDGYQSIGVSPGGAVDQQALRIANLLVGNSEDAACLECCIAGPVLKFHQPAMCSYAGKIQQVAKGEVIYFTGRSDRLRNYIAFAGGIQVPDIMGSKSTDLRAGFGGLTGRALESGDRFAIGSPLRVVSPGKSHFQKAEGSEIELRYLTGVQAHWFNADAIQTLETKQFVISPQSNRMGARLTGPPLRVATTREMVSQPVVHGSIQVAPDGQAIVLLGERQTIGGYPQIGHVVSADLPKLARSWPGTVVRFRHVQLEEALRLKHLVNQHLKRLQMGLTLLV